MPVLWASLVGSIWPKARVSCRRCRSDFANTSCGVADAIGILGREAFVIVIVAVDDDVGVCFFVQGLPERFYFRVITVLAPELKSACP